MADVRDTQQLHVITGRAPATIRVLCRHLRRPDGYAYPDALETLDRVRGEVHGLSPDAGDVLVTAAEAEQYLDIKADRIYQWVHRDQVKPYDHVGRTARFRSEDLMRLRNRETRRAQLDL